MARLKEQYVNEIAPALNKKFGYKSVMQIPKLDKVVINVACGEAKENEKILESVMKDLAQITGRDGAVHGGAEVPHPAELLHPRLRVRDGDAGVALEIRGPGAAGDGHRVQAEGVVDAGVRADRADGGVGAHGGGGHSGSLISRRRRSGRRAAVGS